MLKSYRIFTIRGIEVKVHSTFLLLLLLIGGGSLLAVGMEAAWNTLVLILLIFGCVFLHEMGHSLAAMHYGVKVKDITLLPIGGLARTEDMPEDPKKELVITFAGPAVNFAIAGGLLLVYGVGLPPGGQISGIVAGTDLVSYLFRINLILGVFNLIPAYPMDGGRILRALLAIGLGHDRATHLAASLGHLIAIVMMVVGLFVNIWLLVIGFFIYAAATTERGLAERKLALHGLRVHQAMVTDLQQIGPETTLGELLETIVHSYQDDYPVLDGSRLLGVVSKSALLRGLHDHGKESSVKVILPEQQRTVSVDDGLAGVLQHLTNSAESAFAVVTNERFMGLVTQQNILEILAVSSLDLDESTIA